LSLASLEQSLLAEIKEKKRQNKNPESILFMESMRKLYEVQALDIKNLYERYERIYKTPVPPVARWWIEYAVSRNFQNTRCIELLGKIPQRIQESNTRFFGEEFKKAMLDAKEMYSEKLETLEEEIKLTRIQW